VVGVCVAVMSCAPAMHVSAFSAALAADSCQPPLFRLYSLILHRIKLTAMARAAPDMSRSALYPGVSFAPPARLGAGPFVMQHPRPSGPLHQPTWLIEWLVDGVLEVAIDGADWRRFGPGAGMLYAPHTRYRERCPSGPSRSVVVLFDPGPDPAFDAVRTAGPYRLLEDPTGRATALTSEIV